MLRILHVDDDESIRELTALAFDLGGRSEVRSAPSGEDALKLLADGLRPDLLLLDVMMPEMDGPTLLGCVRERFLPETPAVFMTARTQDEELARLLSLGVVGVIIKPFDPMLLEAQVRAFLEPGA